jgi:crotonobetainyl-CoA:carnitine CoA-transferase CaiB-like acyl-CoA transferase
MVVVGGLGPVCRVLGLEDLGKDQRFDTPKKQWERQEELHALLEAAFVTTPTKEWVRRFEDADMWAAPVNSFREVFSDPQVLHNHMVLEARHPVAGKVRLAGIPAKLSETPAGLRRHPPMLGEHTDEVLRELGYTAEDIRRLREQKVVA